MTVNKDYWYLGKLIPSEYIETIKNELKRRTGANPERYEMLTIIKQDAKKLMEGKTLDEIFSWVERYRNSA